MGDTSAIEWTDATWNPIRGCSRVSAGCTRCYAERDAGRMSSGAYKGLVKKVGDEWRWTGEVRFVPELLDAPRRWRRPRRVFVNSMSDLFHEKVPDGWVMRILNVMARTPHTYQILTKRPERMQSFFTRWADLCGEGFVPKLVRGPKETRRAHPSGRGQLFADMLEAMGTPPKDLVYPTFDWLEGMIYWPAIFPNVWLGVSVEDQATADARIPWLLRTPAAVRFVSYEPALGPVDFSRWLQGWSERVAPDHLKANGRHIDEIYARHDGVAARLDWLIVGGESGPGARPFDVAWARDVIRQGKAAGVPVFCKQLGRAPFDGDKQSCGGEAGWCVVHDYAKLRLRDRKGGDPAEWPEDLRVREFPR